MKCLTLITDFLNIPQGIKLLIVYSALILFYFISPVMITLYRSILILGCTMSIIWTISSLLAVSVVWRYTTRILLMVREREYEHSIERGPPTTSFNVYHISLTDIKY